MSFAANLALITGAIAALLLAMLIVRRAAKQLGLSAEVQRKSVHICTGLFAMTLPWIFRDDWPIYLMLGLTVLVMGALRLPALRGGIGGALHTVDRQSYGDFLLALAVGLVFLFSAREPVLYILPLAVLTLGDAAAALAGSAYGKRQFKVEAGTKSIEGSVIFFLVTAQIAMICLLLLSDVPRGNVITLALLISAFATLVEADSWRGFDNLFLPMGVLIFLSANMEVSGWQLLAQVLLFALATLAFRTIGAALGLSAHSARVYVICAFLLLSVTAWENAILPLSLLLAHAAARRLAPCKERFPDLDIVAAISLVSFGFLALGQALGPNALSFYGLAAACMTLALTCLALAPRPMPLRAILAATSGLILWLVWEWVQLMNPGTVLWHGKMQWGGAALLTLAALPPLLRPAQFQSARAAKITALGALPPALLYVAMMQGSTL
ncbi:hypothetical protein IV417_00880 [Alphaproteobacteria bacterium KMM 3653]|uniref:Phytol kinase n=1 Tax=Harenicola maris TaxID=2841044 RepID=A0AAP2CLW9_9RHOB|nr:hypothetical protein [Harenicola maris]